MKRSFKTAARKAGIEGLRIHDLKHTAITWLLQQGISVWDVATFTGTSAETVQRVYGHHSPDYLQHVANAFHGERKSA